MTETKMAAIVDPFHAGALLAPEFRKRGYECLSVQSSEGLPAEITAACRPEDFVAAIRHAGDLDETAARLRRWPVDLVIAGCETGVNLADQLSERLGLLSNGTALTEARRDKYLMARAVSESGLRVPAQVCSDSFEDVRDWFIRRGGRPVVVKPPASLDSDSVRLCRSEDEVRRAFENIAGRRNKIGTENRAALVQELLEGTQYVVDTVSFAGRHRLAALWQYGKPSRLSTRGGAEISTGREADRELLAYAAIGSDSKEILPCDEERHERLFAYAKGVLDALGIRHGPAHCELMWSGGEPVLVEVGARMHGGQKTPLIVRECAGASQLDLTLEAYLSPERFVADAARPYRLSKRGIMVYLMPWCTGRLRALRRLSEIERLSSFHEMFNLAECGREVPRVAGLVILLHEDKAILDGDVRRIRQLERDGLYELG